MRRFLFQHECNRNSETDRASSDPGGPNAHRRRRIVVAWLLVFVWAGVIWTLGGDDFSMAETSQTLLPWLEWLLGDLEPRRIYRIYAAIRKSAHVVEYGILAMLTFRAALLAVNRNRIATACWAAIFIVAALATADEIRQAFSPVRGGSPYDVLIDIAGGLVALAGTIWISRRFRAPIPADSSA